jgi:hypothetical protein
MHADQPAHVGTANLHTSPLGPHKRAAIHLASRQHATVPGAYPGAAVRQPHHRNLHLESKGRPTRCSPPLPGWCAAQEHWGLECTICRRRVAKNIDQHHPLSSCNTLSTCEAMHLSLTTLADIMPPACRAPGNTRLVLLWTQIVNCKWPQE